MYSKLIRKMLKSNNRRTYSDGVLFNKIHFVIVFNVSNKPFSTLLLIKNMKFPKIIKKGMTSMTGLALPIDIFLRRRIYLGKFLTLIQ